MTDNPITDGVEFSRFVPHDRVMAYCDLGWEVVPMSMICHHDAYSRLMVWRGEGAPVEPAKAVEAVAP